MIDKSVEKILIFGTGRGKDGRYYLEVLADLRMIVPVTAVRSDVYKTLGVTVQTHIVLFDMSNSNRYLYFSNLSIYRLSI